MAAPHCQRDRIFTNAAIGSIRGHRPRRCRRPLHSIIAFRIPRFSRSRIHLELARHTRPDQAIHIQGEFTSTAERGRRGGRLKSNRCGPSASCPSKVSVGSGTRSAGTSVSAPPPSYPCRTCPCEGALSIPVRTRSDHQRVSPDAEPADIRRTLKPWRVGR